MSTWIKRCFFVVLGLMGFHAPNALAAVDMSLCIDGEFGSASDTNTDAGCIDVLAWSWGASNSGAAGGVAGKSNFQDISVTKFQNNSTVWLLRKVSDGKSLPAIDLRVRKSCDIKDCVGPMTFQLSIPAGSLATSVSTGGSGGESVLTDNTTFNFPAIKWCSTELDEGGLPLSTECDGWNVVDNVPYP